MNVTIRGQNIRITDALKEYTEERVSKLYRYLPNISEVRVDFSRQNTKRGGDVTIAQITLRHNRGAILRAEEKLRGEDRESPQIAINLAIDKMYRRIERFKGKKQVKRKGHDKYYATLEEIDIAEDIPEEEYEDSYEDYVDNEQPLADEEIVRRKAVPVPAMTEDEAIEQMELLGHAFFMFANQETNSINVLYRRDEGGYGILVPDEQ